MPVVAYSSVLPDRIWIADPENESISKAAGLAFERLTDGALAVLVKTSRLALSDDQRLALGRAIVDAFAERVAEAFDLDVVTELDRPQRCDLPAGTTRTLLPHHDGGHCSYLTAPALDSAAPKRSLENTFYTTTNEHKIYQGLLLREAGDAMSLTSYFDLVRLVADAWTYQRGLRATARELLGWYQDNVSQAIERAGSNGYLPIGAQLGASGASRDVPIHSYEAEHEIAGQIVSAKELAEQLAQTALGISFSDLMERYAVLAPCESGDLLVGHNLFAWHGGVEGGRGREILPICVTSRPQGPAYERWLALHWERFLARAA
jgi:hypothetical protein